jgi:UDP:flavonoid glycosyltransferase YjiC (YdhE family)
MSRILLAWELGANYGHLARLLPVAQRLRERGHLILFVIRELRHAQTFLAAHGFDFISAPMPPAGLRPPQDVMPASYADILALQGMDRLDMIAPQVAAWHTLFDLFKPDTVVLDHAPVAMLSAQLAGLPRIAIGTGFELPPLDCPFPLFRGISVERRVSLLETEKQIVQTLHDLSARHHRQFMQKAADVFGGTQRIFVTLPELDHYGERGDADYAGVIPNFRGAASAPSVTWPRREKKILAYLQPSCRSLHTVLHALGESGHAVIACVPDANQATTDLATPALQVTTELVNTQALVAQADLVVTHGGHGMASEALLAGKPLLLLPLQLEQSLLARRIEALGVGKVLPPGHAQAACAAAIAALIGEDVYRAAARKIQTKYVGCEPDAVIGRIVQAVERL